MCRLIRGVKKEPCCCIYLHFCQVGANYMVIKNWMKASFCFESLQSCMWHFYEVIAWQLSGFHTNPSTSFGSRSVSIIGLKLIEVLVYLPTKLRRIVEYSDFENTSMELVSMRDRHRSTCRSVISFGCDHERNCGVKHYRLILPRRWYRLWRDIGLCPGDWQRIELFS